MFPRYVGNVLEDVNEFWMDGVIGNWEVQGMINALDLPAGNDLSG